MTTYSLDPTYYQVTWALNSPTDYTALPNNQAGGLDSTSAFSYNRLITISGTVAVSTNVMDNGETMIINGYPIRFDAGMSLANIITAINLATKFTGIIADQRVTSTYITLANAPGSEGYPFYIANSGTGTALAKLGLTAGSYGVSPSELGGSYSNVTTSSNVVINGVNIVFVGGEVASAVTQINAYTPLTGVVAYQAATKIQYSGVDGIPWAINGGNAATNIGATVGNHGGFPTTLTTSENKTRANMRWTQTIAELEQFSSPNFVGNIVRTGNLNGNGACTTFEFTVGYDNPIQLTTVAGADEPDSGNVLIGTMAIKRAVARALTASMVSNQKVFDPTLDSVSSFTARPNAQRIKYITADALDTVANIAIIEQNITVTQISGV